MLCARSLQVSWRMNFEAETSLLSFGRLASLHHLASASLTEISFLFHLCCALRNATNICACPKLTCFIKKDSQLQVKHQPCDQAPAPFCGFWMDPDCISPGKSPIRSWEMRDTAGTCSPCVSWWLPKPVLTRGHTRGTKSKLGGAESASLQSPLAASPRFTCPTLQQ